MSPRELLVGDTSFISSWARAAERSDVTVQFPVDKAVADVWAHLKVTGQRRGRVFGANDLWIAATGHARHVPIVTCDRDFLPMREFGVQVIYLPRHAAASDC